MRKEINFCRRVGVKILGVVENMSGFVCPNCKGESQIFAPTTGGAEAMAKEMDVPFLGKLPLDPALMKACEEGKSFFQEAQEGSPTVASLRSVIDTLFAVNPALTDLEGNSDEGSDVDMGQ